jgi:hypothetical protein
MGRSLTRLFASRRRAIASLGLSFPRELVKGPPEPLAHRIARLDQWIALELDLAGGMHFPAWGEDGEGVARRAPNSRSG